MIHSISIIICCYNSAQTITDALQCILAQELPPGVGAEVILVDNNCTDNTVAIAKEIWSCAADNKTALNIITEKQPGLSAARKAGLLACRYNTIIFCDDDNRLDPNYVYTAYELLNANERIGAAGGRVQGITDGDFPAWWPDHAPAYAVGSQGSKTGDVSKIQYLWGAGLVVRKDLLLKVLDDNYPLLLSDRKGAALSSGGDSEICARILLAGYQLWYFDNLKLQHFIEPGRLTETYRKKLYAGHDAASLVLEKYRHAIIEKNLSGWHKYKRMLRLGFNILCNNKNKAYSKVALNIIANTSLPVQDDDYKKIIAYIKFVSA